MEFPYFTSKDPALIASRGGRDPLGVQPVWSAFGRALVPNLASSVTGLDGIKAVILIHWLEEKVLKPIGQEDRARSYFKLMEGILEYYLWQTSGSTKSRQCYGVRALAAQGHDFRVVANDSSTAVNGLYLYYRGTCRRAGLLQDWKAPEPLASLLLSQWRTVATDDLTTAVKGALSEKGRAIVPALLLKDSQALKESLDKVFESVEFQEILRNQLLGEPCHVQFAAKCSKLLEMENSFAREPEQGWAKWRVDRLDELLQKENSVLLEPLRRVQRCESFLLVLQDCFDCLLASPGATLTEVAKELDNRDGKLQERARRFLTLEDALDSERMRQLVALAGEADSGMQDFLAALVAHHARCMSERGRDAFILIDADRIVVPVAAERDKASAQARLEKATPWDNGYYLYNAGTIHRQLFGGQRG